jgi:hypothetical protein
MTKPGTKYFKGRIVCGDTVSHLIIWDGVRDYQNGLPAVGAMMVLPPGDVIIAHINKQRAETPITKLFQQLRAASPTTSPNVHVILCARDHTTYRRLVNAFESSSSCRLQ